MDLFDLLGEERNRKKWRQNADRHSRRDYDHDDEKNYHDEYPLLNRRGYETEEDYHSGHDKIRHILNMLKSHPHKKILVVGAFILGVVILIACLALVLVMFPLIMKAVYYVEKNGVQGAAEFITKLLTKIWEGNG